MAFLLKQQPIEDLSECKDDHIEVEALPLESLSSEGEDVELKPQMMQFNKTSRMVLVEKGELNNMVSDQDLIANMIESIKKKRDEPESFEAEDVAELLEEEQTDKIWAVDKALMEMGPEKIEEKITESLNGHMAWMTTEEQE